MKSRILENLIPLYGEETARAVLEKIEARFGSGPERGERLRLSERDVMLITYGDSIRRPGQSHLKTLEEFLSRYTGGLISSVHLLPICPYTSDDGFSVTDYLRVEESLGGWEDVERLGQKYHLMLDAVINHISRSSFWFQRCLAGDPEYRDFFIEADPDKDYGMVARPRALPLLTAFHTENGEKYFWTTFGEDQIDLNYRNPDLLLEILEVLLAYAKHGAGFLRLDAIGYAWKKEGTSCLNLPETHRLVKLFRAFLDKYAPKTLLITETNVPHRENVAYFGSGCDEAQMVYQFPLPPLVLFSFLTEDASRLSAWAEKLALLPAGAAYFNFLASHDGIGLRPAEGILTDDEIQFLVNRTLRNGGRISCKSNPDGSTSPYELNISYQDALSGPEDCDELRVGRFVASQTLLLSLAGMPGIYIHSLVGSRNDYFDLAVSGINRRINREKLDYQSLCSQLDRDTNRSRIFRELLRRIAIRNHHRAFHPNAKQTILKIDPRLFVAQRQGEGETVTAVVNVSAETVDPVFSVQGTDLLSGNKISGAFSLSPLQCMWILHG